MEIPSIINLYFDGAAEPNPGVATYGWIILDSNNNEIKSASGVASNHASNNYAEYCALGFALRFLKDNSWSGKLNIFGDSQLVINQLTMTWQCRAPHLIKLRDRCLELLEIIDKEFVAAWIPRAQNEKSDSLSQYAYERFTGNKFPQRRRKS